jgi:serine/threonine protein kinase
MSPERILADIDVQERFDSACKCDTYSIGVILYLLVFGELPFEGTNTSKLVKEIKKDKI